MLFPFWYQSWLLFGISTIFGFTLTIQDRNQWNVIWTWKKAHSACWRTPIAYTHFCSVQFIANIFSTHLAHSHTPECREVVRGCWNIPPAGRGHRTSQCVPCSIDSLGRRWVQDAYPSRRPRCWDGPHWYPGIHPYRPNRQWRRCASPERRTPQWWANAGLCILSCDPSMRENIASNIYII